MGRLRTLLTITSIRLSLVYTLIFGLVAVVIVLYMTTNTTAILRRQIAESIALEVVELGAVYERGGINALMRTLERNAAAPGAKIYIVSDPAGRVIAGNVQDIDTGVIDQLGWTSGGFGYRRFEDGSGNVYKAIAQVIELPNGMRLLVGRDLGEPERFREVVGRALAISLGAMVLTGLLTWVLIGRTALKRLDQVSRSSSRILGGDRSERLPVSGVGDEFDRLSVSLNEMLDRIGALEIGLRHVSDNIAHDLKTPLTRLRNKADQALAGRRTGKDYRAVLQEIIADTDGIITTFDALLMIARAESGSSPAQLDPVDFSQIASDVAELYQPVAEDAGFSFTTAIEPGITVTGNRELLSRAAANLVDNALKYGKPDKGGSHVGISLSRQGGQAVLCVADRGPGIAQDDYSRAVERFSRLEETGTGSGLGLSLVNAIARLHGGTLELGGNGPGLRAGIRIPLRQDAAR